MMLEKNIFLPNFHSLSLELCQSLIIPRGETQRTTNTKLDLSFFEFAEF